MTDPSTFADSHTGWAQLICYVLGLFNGLLLSTVRKHRGV